MTSLVLSGYLTSEREVSGGAYRLSPVPQPPWILQLFHELRAQLRAVLEPSAIASQVRTAARPNDWLLDSLYDIELIANQPPGWDGFGAYPATSRAVLRALEFLTELHVLVSRPRLVGTAEGGIQVEWYKEGRDFTVEFHPDGRSDVFYSDGTTSWEGGTAQLPRRWEELLMHTVDG